MTIRIHKQRRHVAPKLLMTALLITPPCFAGCGDAGRSEQSAQHGSPAPASSVSQQPGVADASAQNNSTQKAQPASSSSSGAQAEGRILLDYRKGLRDEPLRLDAQEMKRIVQAAYGAQAKADGYTVNGSARGSFTGAGRTETVYLVQPGGPLAADPNGAQDLSLVVFDEAGRAVARLKTRDFNFIEGKADVDGDGVEELLLAGSFYNMGTLASSLRIVALKDKRLRVVKEFEGVYENPCEGDAGAHVTAGVITYSPTGASIEQGLRLTLYRAPCPAKGEEQPNPQSFVPVEDEKRHP